MQPRTHAAESKVKMIRAAGGLPARFNRPSHDDIARRSAQSRAPNPGNSPPRDDEAIWKFFGL